MATSFSEFQKRLLESAFQYAQQQSGGQLMPPMVPPSPPPAPLPPMIPPWMQQAPAPMQQYIPPTPPPMPQPKAKTTTSKEEEIERGRQEIIERIKPVFPEIDDAHFQAMSDEELANLYRMAQDQGMRYIEPPPFTGMSRAEQEAQAQAEMANSQQQPLLGQTVSGAIQDVEETARTAYAGTPAEDVLAAINPFDQPGVANVATGYAVTGKDPRTPDPMTATQAMQQGRAAADYSQLDEGRADEIYDKQILEPWRQEYSQEELATALEDTRTAITKLEQTQPTPENQQQLTEDLEALRESEDAAEAILFVLYGVEPEQPDQPWYKDALEYGMKGIALADLPRQYFRPVAGTLVYIGSQETPLGRLFRGHPVIGTTVQAVGEEEIQRLFEEEGGTSVWENAVANVPELENYGTLTSIFWHGLSDSAFDPLNVLGTAATVSRGIPYLGRTIAAANAAANIPGDAALTAIRTVARPVAKAPGVRSALRLTGEELQRRDVLERAQGFFETQKPRIDPETGGMTPPPTANQITPIPGKGPRPAGEARTPGQVFQETTQQAQRAAQTEEAAENVRQMLDSFETPDHPSVDGVPGKPFTKSEFNELKKTITRLTAEGQTFDEAFDAAYRSVVDKTPIPPAAVSPEIDLTPGQAPAPTTPVRPRNVTGDPFNDTQMQEFVARTQAGENADTVIDDIRTTQQQGAAEAIRPQEPQGPVAPEADTSLTLTTEPRFQHLNPGAKRGLTTRLIDRLAALPESVRNQVWPEVRRLTDELVSDPRYTGSPIDQRVKPDWRQAGGQAWPEAVRTYQYVTDLARIFRRTGNAVDPETVFTAPRRVGSVAKGAPTKDDNTDWLMQRFIHTTDDAEATSILGILRGVGISVKGPNRSVRKGGFGNVDRTTKDLIVPDYTEQVIADLQKVRDDWQALMREGAQVAPTPPVAAAAPTVPEQAALPETEGIRPAPKRGKAPKITELSQKDGVIFQTDEGSMLRISDDGDIYNLNDKVIANAPTFEKARDLARRMLRNRDPSIGLTPTSTGTPRKAVEMFNRWTDKYSGIRQPDELTEVVDDSAEVEAFLTGRARKDNLGAFVRAGDLGLEDAKMFDEVIPIARAQVDPTLTRTGKRRFSPSQTAVRKQLEKEGIEEIRRWDLFQRILLQNKGNIDATIVDFAAISGLNATELKRGLKQLAAFYNGARTAVSHAWQYNLPRLGYNLTQDSMTDMTAQMADGELEAAYRMLRGFKNQVELQLSMSRYTPTRKVGMAMSNRFPSTVTREVEELNEILELPAIKGTHGARFDEGGNLIEETQTWWTKHFKIVGSIVAPDFARNLRAGFDDIKRVATHHEYKIRNVGRSQDEFLDYVREYAAKQGVDPEDWIAKINAAGADYHGRRLFGPTDVRTAIGGGQGEHLARRWRSHLNQLDADAKRHMEKYLFTYRQLVADKYIGKVWLFHYWMTRASVLHARLALDHPWLMAAYYRSWEGMENMEGKENLPAWAQHFIGLNVGPYGMLGLTSPAAMLAGFGAVMDLNGLNLDDPQWRDVLQVLPTNPIIMAAASVYLNDRTPDLTGTNQVRQFYRAAANSLNAQLGMPIDGVIPDHVAQGTFWLQEVARAVLPGGKPIEGPSPEERDTQQVQFYASQILQERDMLLDENGAPTDEANAVMANIDAGLYSGEIEQEAYERFTTDTLAGRLAMTQFPIQTTTSGFAAEQRTLNKEGDQAARGEAQFIPGSIVSDQPMIVSTAAEKTPEQAAADYTVKMTDAGDPEATEFLGQVAQYDLIGNEDQRNTWDLYHDLLFSSGDDIKRELGGTGGYLDLNYTIIPLAEWDQMDEDARRLALDEWIEWHEYTPDWEAYRAEREAFEEANPMVADFKDWQGWIRDTGAQEALDMLLDKSPSFRAWWENQQVNPAEIQMRLMGPNAYLASEGIKPGHWDSRAVSGDSIDPGALSVRDVMAPKEGEGYESTPSFEKATTEQRIEMLNEDLVEFEQEYNAFDREVQQMTGRSYGNLSNASLMGLGDRLPKVPKGSGIVQSYFEWALQQPQGTNTSVEAYIRWYERMELENAA